MGLLDKVNAFQKIRDQKAKPVASPTLAAKWTSAKSVANVLACNRPTRDESDSFSPDYHTPTTFGGPFGGLTEAIKNHGPRNVDSGEPVKEN